MLAPDGPIQVTAEARAMAPMLVRPPLPLAPGWAVDALALPGLALLPPATPRRPTASRGVRADERMPRLIAAGVRAWTSVVPTTLRSMPQARAADRRARGAEAAPD